MRFPEWVVDLRREVGIITLVADEDAAARRNGRIGGDAVFREHGAVADLMQRGRFGIYGSEEHAAGASPFLGWLVPADRVGGAKNPLGAL